MQSFKRLLIVIVALALAAGVVFFTLENRTATQLVFFGWQTPELPMALYVRMRYNIQIKQLKVSEQRIAELQKAAAEQDVPVSGAAELPNVS